MGLLTLTRQLCTCRSWLSSSVYAHSFYFNDKNVLLSVVRYQEELPTLISSRTHKHITLSELVKLMEWKLTVSTHRLLKNLIPKDLNTPLQEMSHSSHKYSTVQHGIAPERHWLSFSSVLVWPPCAFLQRGKFRPRLQQLVASNSAETVEKCSRKAFSLLPDVQAAIAELSSLKGVGPATASG